MSERILLPIRIVDPSRDFSKRNTSGGSSDVTSFLPEDLLVEHKEKLMKEIENTLKLSHEEFQKYHTPGLIKAKLQEKAIAKSHRPKSVLNQDTCPIVGGGEPGELFLSSTEKGITKLKDRISESSSKKELKVLSSLEQFSKFKREDRLSGLSLLQLKEKSKRNEGWALKIITADHKDKEINREVEHNLKKYCVEKNIKIDQLTKIIDLKMWIVELDNFNTINYLLDHPAIKQISFFPSYKIVRKAFEVEAKVPELPIHDQKIDYPSIVIIDSGISIKHPCLKDWVRDRFQFVPDSESDYDHGSAVASLACFGHYLNPELCSEEDCLEIVDVQVLPSDTSTTPLTEDRLIVRLDEAIPEIVKKYKTKIFNMSLGFKNKSCEDFHFSKLGMFLDELQEKYDILILLPSGNNGIVEKQRSWPPENEIEEERLQIPADSVRSITVGAIACKERKDSIVKKGEPASYSCIGPGPAHTVKPDIVHYSGNLSIINGDADFSKQGIILLNSIGKQVEDVGTSYSAPLAARSLSLLQHKLDQPSILLLKALIVHHSKNPLQDNLAIKYVGYGLPTTVDEMIGCGKNEITLIFEKEISQGYHLECPFHWPASLIKKGKCFGEIEMTLVARVPLDDSYDSEYIRANLTASLQSVNVGKGGKIRWKREVEEIISTEQARKLFESDLIEQTFKWKPIKKYSRNITNGVTDAPFRFTVNLLLRDGVELKEPIPFVLIFTLKDPEGIHPIYDEVVNGLRVKNIHTQPIRLRERIRQKLQ